ncbi:MAG: ComF family protein [Myxococcota bacterium]
MPSRWREAFEAMVDVVLPPACAVCDAVLPSAGAFCDDCAREVLELPTVHCPRCAEPGAFGGVCERCALGVPWARAWAPFEHEGAVARAIHRFKYEDRSDLARPLGLLLAASARAAVASMPGTVVPLPLHEARFRQRRYDQAALLASTLAPALGRPLELGWLARVRDTPRQVGLTEEQREQNVRGAFAASPVVQGHDVLLVDDVLTSGASAREASRALLAAGAARVFVLTLARARSVLRSDAR